MTQSRTLNLDREIRNGLFEAARTDCANPLLRIESLGLPEALSLEEIGHLGLHVEIYTEERLPSRNGHTNGQKAATSVLESLAHLSFQSGDYVTANSIVGHFQEGGDFKRRFLGWSLAKILNKRCAVEVRELCEDVQSTAI